MLGGEATLEKIEAVFVTRIDFDTVVGILISLLTITIL